jgi:23S rRNA (adenine2030-N6)-methyltransferase
MYEGVCYTAASYSRNTMLSYRHLFHAGNPADIFKHAVQVLIMQYLQKKEKPFVYLDTHASTGLYDLTSDMAQKNKEYSAGIGKIYLETALPQVLSPYMDCVKSVNAGGACTRYPGSVAIARHLLREQDRGHCFEFHPRDFAMLQQYLKGSRLKAYHQDGLAGLKALLPPKESRALVMIDPSYEVKTEYQSVIRTLKICIKKFPQGVYVIWYPLLSSHDNHLFRQQIRSVFPEKAMQTEFRFNPLKKSHGMHGCGLYIINPPYILADQLAAMLPYLTRQFST